MVRYRSIEPYTYYACTMTATIRVLLAFSSGLPVVEMMVIINDDDDVYFSLLVTDIKKKGTTII